MSRFIVAVAALFAVVSCRTLPPRPALPPAAATDDDPDARDRWYWEQRALPAGTIPADVHRAAVLRELAAHHASDGEPQWEELGPAPLHGVPYDLTAQDSGGRTLTVAIAPNDPNTIFAGTAQGGMWKSTDGGASFHAVAETTLPSLAINIIKFKPGQPDVIYAGTGEPNAGTSIYGAGLLRSTDGGTTWEQLPPRGDGWDFDYVAITGLQFDARDSETMYASTAAIAAPMSFFRTPPDQPQTGIFKSADGGRSWKLLHAAVRYPLPDGPAPTIGILDLEYGGAAAPSLLYASENYGGLLKSEDGGETWTAITPHKPNGLGTFPADVPRLSVLDTATHTYRSGIRFPNDDNTPEFRRAEIAVAPSNPNVVYAGFAASINHVDWNGDGVYDPAKDRTFVVGLLFKSVDRGATWQWLGSLEKGVPNYCGSQCTYDNVITVNPDNPDDVLLGGQFDASTPVPDRANSGRLVQLPWRGMVYRSLDGGRSWIDTTPQCTKLSTQPISYFTGIPVYGCASADAANVIHPDVHAVVFGPSGTIYVGTDGGLYRGTQATVPPPASRRRVTGAQSLPGLSYRWEDLNHGIGALQFYRIASHPTDANILLGGMQDNAVGHWNGTSWDAWGGGDGTVAAFDPNQPSRVYLGAQFTVLRSDEGGGTFEHGHWRVIASSSTVNGEQLSFVPVFALDHVQPLNVYAATDKGLLRSTDYGTHTFRVLPSRTTDGVPTTISISPVNHNVVWLGTSTGHVYRYDFTTSTPTMTDVSGSLPNRSISRLVAAYDDASTVYAVFNGYDANTPEKPGKVFVTSDGGLSWRNVSNGLPDVPVTAIALDPHDTKRLWVASDAAVYATTDRGETWTSIRRNMPVVAVQDLDYNANTGYLVAATHGRGAWRMKQ